MLRAAILCLAAFGASSAGIHDDPPESADEAYREILTALSKKSKARDRAASHALARPLLVDFVERFPDAVQRGELLQFLAEIDGEARRFDDAAASLQRYLREYPDAPREDRVRADLAELLCFAGRGAEALDVLDGAAVEEGPSVTLRLARVELLRLLGRPAEAAASARASLDELGEEHPLGYAFEADLAELAWVGRAFPEFEFAPLAAPDAPLRLAELRGQPVLVDLWASWCGPCLRELPNRKDVHDRYHERGYRVVGVSLDETREALDDALERWQLPWPQHHDGLVWDTPLALELGLTALPASYLLDRDGVVIEVDLDGYALEHQLQRLLER